MTNTHFTYHIINMLILVIIRLVLYLSKKYFRATKDKPA